MYILRLACATQERFLATYPARQAASVDLEGAVYAVAAFYLCAKKLKVMAIPMLGIMFLFPQGVVCDFSSKRQVYEPLGVWRSFQKSANRCAPPDC